MAWAAVRPPTPASTWSTSSDAPRTSPNRSLTRTWNSVNRTRRIYRDCGQETAAALARLRPQAYGPARQVWTDDPLPAGASTYIVCAEDRIVNPDWSRRVAPDRLGAAVIELGGGHSPFLSRPAELAGVLDGLA